MKTTDQEWFEQLLKEKISLSIFIAFDSIQFWTAVLKAVIEEDEHEFEHDFPHDCWYCILCEAEHTEYPTTKYCWEYYLQQIVLKSENERIKYL